MKNLHRKSIALVILALVLLLMQTAAVAADDVDMQRSSTEPIYLRGLVSEIDGSENAVIVRPLKGKRITIHFGPDTILKNMNTIDDLSEKQDIKVWYFVHDGRNEAVKIEKLLDLGC
jgi:cytochrome oxidase Cu insertion factor (SCO1/SenC/PrrC family)